MDRQDVGFFYIKNTGLDERLPKAFEQAHKFFALPDEEKEAVRTRDTLTIDFTRCLARHGQFDRVQRLLGIEVSLPIWLARP
jgi:isopenicillin N synthase-like dioxygenase